MDTTIKLHYGSTVPDDIKEARSEVWTHLYELTEGVLRGYFGDLYHDAIWLYMMLKGPSLTFYYSFNDSGTTIGFEEETLTRRHKYRITVSVERGSYTMRIQGA